MPGLGYRYADDPRDHPFRGVVAPTPAAAPPKPRVRAWRAQPSLDQGETGTCVGHTARHWLQTAPIVDAPAVGPDAFALYRAAILVDEWPDNDAEADFPNAELQFGTSVRAAMKALHRQGYLKEYVRAFSVTEIQVAVKMLTPVCLGTDWATSMFTYDRQGVVRFRPESRIAGGHAYLCHWFDPTRGLFLLQNSWGRWGVDHPTQRTLTGRGGFFYLPGEDLEALLRRDGEAWTALELRRRRPRSTTSGPTAGG